MSERTLKNNDEVYSVTIRDYKEGSIGKSLQSEIVINCKNYTIFCDIVESVKRCLNGE